MIIPFKAVILSAIYPAVSGLVNFQLFGAVKRTVAQETIRNMGGNYFNLGRLPREEYLEIEADIRSFLDKRYGKGKYRIPRYYEEKPDFGDLDVLLSTNAIPGGTCESLKQDIIQALGIEKYGFPQKKFLSTVYRQFQVDYFLVSEDRLDVKMAFFDFNDLGNFRKSTNPPPSVSHIVIALFSH